MNMRLSKGFWQTYKEVPKDAEVPSHRLMMRAGLIHKAGSGLYNYLPMGYRSIRKTEQLVREELDKVGCLETLMTVVTPGELWQETGRWEKMQDVMLKFKDKNERDLCISPTNEEAITDIFRKSISSYKNLPVTLYQINTKFRDEIRPRFGLMRGREFIMKDAYSFHADKECLDRGYDLLYQAYSNIFKRIGLDFIVVQADGGAMTGGKAKTHEFQVVADVGEDEVIQCPNCLYAANVEAAQTKRKNLTIEKDQGGDPILVDTPGKQTIEDVCHFLQIDQHKSLKSLAYEVINGDQSKNVLIFILGDEKLNEIKLSNYYQADHVKPLTDGQMHSTGLLKGYIGPYQLNSGGKLEYLFDQQIILDAGYVVGANQDGKHFQNYVPSRHGQQLNYQVVDLRLAKENDNCSACENGIVKVRRGIEVGHIFQLGDKYSKAMEAQVLDKNGKRFYPLMGCYGIGITRTVAAAIEQFHDENGIIWPKELAPYQIYFGQIAKTEEIKNLGESIYSELVSEGFEVVYDDRGVGPGSMFKDADLLGLPLRVVLGERDYLKDGLIEVKRRDTGEVLKVKKEELVTTLRKLYEIVK